MFQFRSDIAPELFDQVRNRFSLWEPLIKGIALASDSDSVNLKPFSEGSNVVFACGSERVIKVFPEFLNHQFAAERAALAIVKDRVPVRTPRLIQAGVYKGWPFIVMDLVPGETLSSKWDELPLINQAAILKDLGGIIAAHHRIQVTQETIPSPVWKDFIRQQAGQCEERHRRLKIPSRLSAEIPAYLARNLHLIPLEPQPPILLTGEFTPGNILVEKKDGEWAISALIDYADSMIGHCEYDLLGPGTFLAAGNKVLLESFFTGYGCGRVDDRDFTTRLATLLLLHRYSNLEVQIKDPRWKQAHSLDELRTLVWPWP